MSVIDDVRKVAQDFIAPELRGINERLTALEKRVDLTHSEMLGRFADLRTDMAKQNDNLRSDMARQTESLRTEFQNAVAQIVQAIQVNQRLDWLEAQVRKQLPPKEQ
jgi:hypothetical protein